MCIVTLDALQIQEARELATETYRRWHNMPGHYPNAARSHFIGKLGEIAVESLLNGLGCSVTSNFRNPEHERLCDIETSDKKGIVKRIEVKTWSEQYWGDLGRCVAVTQVEDIEGKCDAIVWCIVIEPIPSYDNNMIQQVHIRVRAWSTPHDVRRAEVRLTGRFAGRPGVLNHQLDEDNLRKWDDLLTILMQEVK